MSLEVGHVDKEIEKAGLKNGFEVWRVQGESLVRLPEVCFGSFYDENCYILLKTRELGRRTKFSLHYWIGNNADKTNKSNTSLLCKKMYYHLEKPCTQYREVQGSESDEFLKYFKHGIVYMKGAVPETIEIYEALPHFDVKRLFLVTNQLPARALQVDFAWENFNNCGVMLVDIGNVIIVWKGSKSSVQNATKARLIADHIKSSEREGLSHIHTMQGFQDSHDIDILQSLLGPKPDSIPEDRMSVEVEKKCREEDRLLTIFILKPNQSKEVELFEETYPCLNKRCLLNDECYLFDVPSSCKIFVWKGLDVEPRVKAVVWKVIMNYMDQTERAFQTQVQVIDDGCETDEFIDLFDEWEKEDMIADRKYSIFNPTVEKPVTLGEGKLNVYLIDNRNLVPINPSDHGKFYSLDCYIVKFTFEENGKERKFTYYWEGRRSLDEVGDETNISSSTSTSSNRHKHVTLMRLEGTTECRVELGKEPSHFIALFKGKFIILKGNDPLSSQKKPLPPTNSTKVPGVFLYIVKGTNEFNTKVIQVPCSASSLNCNYPFICTTPRSVYLWFGKGCIGDQRSMAHMMADTMLATKNLVVIEEGKESSRFFSALGGKKPYLNLAFPKDPEVTRYIKTYQCGIDRKGEFVFSEAYDLVQKDLDPNSVVLIDRHDEILMWLGSHVETHVAVQSFQMAFAYLKGTKDRSDMKTAVVVVKQDHEPVMFTRLFPSWDPTFTMDDSENRVTAESVKRLLVNRYGLPTFSQEELSDNCPEGVDPVKKEKYLTEQEFLAVFRMTREDFAKKSEWTRTDLKKKYKLF